LFILLVCFISAFNLTNVRAVTDGSKSLDIAADDGDGFLLSPEDGEQITVDWTSTKSVKAYIVTDANYSKVVGGNTNAHLVKAEGASGQLTYTVVEGGRYWVAFYNDNAESVTVEATYNTGGINWAMIAMIGLIILFIIVGVIGILKGYVFQDHGDGTVSWKKSS